MQFSTLTDLERLQLLQAASDVLNRAYVPYSGFRVGAAVLTEQGNLYTGCNVENASYSLGICAERVAICQAVASEGEDMKLFAVAVVNEQNLPCSPCGACRQFIFEFGVEAAVIFTGRDGLVEMPVCELLPEGFVFG